MSQITEKDCSRQKSKLLDIQVRDLSDTIMECILWENHTEDVYSYVTKKNCRFSTKLFLDGDLSEIAEFKMQLGNRDSNDVHRVSQLMTPDLSNKVEDSFPLSSWESIDQITKTSQENTCVTFARILEF
ncbi:PREDICTED: uncharacterized protein LOC104719746 isoform X2 [Camelina sativa]|uniref:Uncharacterized protein LOC104719746 isoform X2 n=1 Tax=Camelina sativa TaxID=90675 RepID=A0ABM1QHC4_CAMSA|nr:PREDICTED: uncharacterized protein LOC104719746 isoform X2 [Camelina sativa]